MSQASKDELERIIAARTQELSATNEELWAQNEEIVAMNEEIATLNTALTELNEKLEAKVSERTIDLQTANRKIMAQYEELVSREKAMRRSSDIQIALRDIAEVAVSGISLDALYASVHQLAIKVLPAQNFNIAFLDETADEIVMQYCVDTTATILLRRPVGDGLVEKVLRECRTLTITPEELDCLRESGVYSLPFRPTNDWLGAPLVNSKGKCFGVISLTLGADEPPFPEDAEGVFAIIAAQIALAIERKQAEIALVTSENRLQRAQTIAHVGNWEIELGNKQMWASAEAFRIYGIVQESPWLPLGAAQQIVCKDDRPKMDQALKALLQTNEKYDMEFRILRADNGQERMIHSVADVFYDSKGAPAKVIGVIQDITDRKRAEDELEDSEARYRAMLEQAPEAVLIFDPETGDIIETNARFVECFGHDINCDGPMSVFALVEDKRENLLRYMELLKQNGKLPMQRRLFRHRNGVMMPVERSSRMIRYRGRTLSMTSVRDVSDEVRREQEIKQDAQLATKVQNALLRLPAPSEHVQIVTVYHPYSYVGGDLYVMDWRYRGLVLRGFLIDTTGHGLGTALHTAAMHVLLREVNELDLPLVETVRWLNQRASGYFDDGTFAGALCFELDLESRQLRWVCAGISDIWVATKTQQGSVTQQGMYLGLRADESFEMHTISVDVDDSLYFVTDGLADLLERQDLLPLDRFPAMCGLLKELSLAYECRDDATALCVHVMSFPATTLRKEGWPRRIHFSGYGDYQRLKSEVSYLCAEVTGKQHSLQEVAVNEALANALECRDGVQRQHQARVKFNRIGDRLVVRVRTTRIGFAGNAVLRRLRSHPEEMFAYGEDASMGRGIPMMLSLSRWMTYNNDGTEVLLVWKLGGKKE